MPSGVEIVRAALAAFDARDVETFLGHLAEDVVLRPPGFILGEREQRGREEVRAAFFELEETLGPREFDFLKRRYFVDREDESKVLLVSELSISPPGGEPFGAEAAQVMTITGDRISRIDSWRSETEGLAQLTDPAAVDG
jgi:ketosteroid isomerase-like protein